MVPYKIKYTKSIKKTKEQINQKIMKNKDKILLQLLEYCAELPRLYGSTKTPKANKPTFQCDLWYMQHLAYSKLAKAQVKNCNTSFRNN